VTQALADRVLKDADTFTIRKDDGTVAGLRWWMPGIVRTLANSMLSMDEPDHKRLRDIVDGAFRRRAVLEMEPHIQATGDALADELFAEGSPADLQLSSARSANTLPPGSCRLTPASFSMTARAAASGSSRIPVIAVCSAHTAQSRARDPAEREVLLRTPPRPMRVW
jgi:hypothetical protein